MQHAQQEAIAIIGLGCRFPSAENPQAFWRLLREGGDAIREVPANRWKIDELYDPDPMRSGKMISRWGGFVDNTDQFDWRMFHMLPREAKYVDPQHRLLLEVAWEALEDAGLPLTEVAGSRTSVSIGISWNDYLRLQARDWSQFDGYTAVGNLFAFAANRISYFFDLKGPSISLDTACASSLTSVYLACQSLWTGEATLALAGGVNLLLSPDSSIIASKAGLLSSEGRCKTLDARADGFVRGEGAGIIVLKPLSQVRPADRVYALIRGVAVNHNGHNEWIMATSSAAQEALLRDAYGKAGIDPAEIDYVELHGTGFLQGDAIEARALGAVVGGRAGRKRPCLIGSVKTNIGHLDSASGIASMIKVALSLYHREIPPTLRLQTINPDIPLDELQLAPQMTSGPWPDKKGTPLAGVTALAFTGTNAHVVLEGSSSSANAYLPSGQPEERQLRLLPLSATSGPALSALVGAFKEMLVSGDSSWQDICYTASVRRSHHKYRLAITAFSRQEAARTLEAVMRGQEQFPSVSSSAGLLQTSATRQDRLVFLFARRSTHCTEAEAAFVSGEPVFQATVDECDQVIRRYTGSSLWKDRAAEVLFPGFDKTPTGDPATLFTFQVALAALWRYWGVIPDAVLGEGLGEVAAAYVAGALSLEGALRIIIHQSALAGRQIPSPEIDWGALSERVQTGSTTRPIYSAASGRVLDGASLLASSCEEQSSRTGISEGVMNQLRTDGYNVFVELGPYSMLSEMIRENPRPGNPTVTALPSFGCEGAKGTMLETLGALYTLGYKVNWPALYSHGGQCVSLPTYPWQRERLWLDWLDVEEISSPPESWRESKPIDNHNPGVCQVETEQSATERLPLLSQLENATPEKQRDILIAHVREQAGCVLGLDVAYLQKPQQKLFALGMDSLTAAQLVNRLQSSLGRSLPAAIVFNYPTIESLSDHLIRELLFRKQEEHMETHRQEARLLAEIEQLSEARIEAMLIDKLTTLERRY